MTKEDISNVVRDLESELKACDADIELINKKREYARSQMAIYNYKNKEMDDPIKLLNIIALYDSVLDDLFLAEFGVEARRKRCLSLLDEFNQELRAC